MKKTKHIKAKFFFIKDWVDNGEIKVIDCPAEEMWADILTKPLQGMAFQTMRAQFMNCAVNYEDLSNKPIKTHKEACCCQVIGDLEWNKTNAIPDTTCMCWAKQAKWTKSC